MSIKSSDNEICRMDALTLARRIKARDLSALEATEAVLRRMDVLEPYVHAFCTPTPEHARTAAKSIDAELAKGEAVGPLAGVPVGIKDLVATKGIRTVMGSVLYKDFVPDEDDIVVERLKAAGAVIIGKTNVPELGYSGVGPQPGLRDHAQPVEPRLDVGRLERRLGRVGGRGRGAVRHRQRRRRLDAHSGGALRPLRHQGVDGTRAALSGLPRRALSRCVELGDARAYRADEPHRRGFRADARVIAGPDPRDRYSIPAADFDWLDAVRGDISGLRVAYSADWGYAAVDPEVRASSAPRPRYSRASSAARSSARTPAGVPTSARPSRR